jgi:hypothetical protein
MPLVDFKFLERRLIHDIGRVVLVIRRTSTSYLDGRPQATPLMLS